jgi:methylmalonyl-CoA mutase cobalamin-binding domain/chain
VTRRPLTAMTPGAELLAEGADATPAVIHQTAYLRLHDAASECEVKLRARRERRVTYHAQVGSTDWPATAAVLTEIEASLAERGAAACDRFGLTLSRAMSVEADERGRLHKETGPQLGPDDWVVLGEAAAIQPHLGDFMIGTPAGFEHAVAALQAGVTTIGNLGQYSAYETPGGQDDVQVTEQAIRAIGLLAACRSRGTLVHSYLEDGVAMQAGHYGSYLGWAALEVHLVETLCGARLAHSYGGLIDTPSHRALVHLALDDLHGRDSIGSMVYGNTVDMRPRDREHNQAVLAGYLLVDIACQLHRPTGHAVHPVPLTEAERVPSAAENVEVQLIARELEREARRSGDLVNWPALERLAAALAAYATEFRDRALSRLADDGVDVTDPARLLLAMRRLGMTGLEHRVDLAPPTEISRLEPWKAGQMRRIVERLARALPRLDGERVVLAVVDVHDVVRDAFARALPDAGCEVILLPTDVTAAAIVEAAVAEDADAILLGTYNGAALSICRDLRSAVDRAGYDGRVIVGGRLNEDTGGDLPVDVTDDVRRLGFAAALDVEDAVRLLAADSRAAAPGQGR